MFLHNSVENIDKNNENEYIREIYSENYINFMLQCSLMANNWEKEYKGDRDISWSLIAEFDDGSETKFEGNGAVPRNWNELIDLLCKYEIIFKSKKELDIEKIQESN